MLFIKVLTTFFERMKYENNNYVHYFNITLKIVLPQGVGRRPPTWGKARDLARNAEFSKIAVIIFFTVLKTKTQLSVGGLCGGDF